MDYSKVYYQIIENAKAENRTKNDNIYYEEHHIIPRSLNGSDDENNKVLLADKEHYICHKLLTYVYKGNRKMTCAFHFMTFSKKYGKLVSSRDYQYAKELLRKTPVSEETRKKLSIALKGRPFAKKGIPLSAEHKNKISKSITGEGNGMYGRKHTLKSIEKNRKSNTGKKLTEKTKNKMSLSRTGSKRNERTKERMRKAWESRRKKFPMSKETKRKIGENTAKHRKGSHHTDETKLKMSLSQKGRKHKKVNCPYCGKQCTPSTLSRWHNNNCKSKI